MTFPKIFTSITRPDEPNAFCKVDVVNGCVVRTWGDGSNNSYKPEPIEDFKRRIGVFYEETEWNVEDWEAYKLFRQL